MLAWRQSWWIVVTVQSARDENFVTIAITSLIGWDRMQEYFLICITTHAYVRELHIFSGEG